MEMSFLSIRAATDNPQTPFSPHNGSGAWRLPGVGHSYSSLPGKAHAGLCRAVWELNPVDEGDGGTIFITGSHKANFDSPADAASADSELWSTYSCPAGSLILFTEATSHSGVPWTNMERDRVAVFSECSPLQPRGATVSSRLHVAAMRLEFIGQL